MLGASPLDAYERILSRAQDLRDAFRAGSVPLNDDVRTAPNVTASSDPLSVVPPPGAWLVTRGADGVRAYERDGALTLDGGVLRSPSGAEVLGYPGGDARGAVPVPLRIADTDRALGRGADARVEHDGTVAYTRAAIDPRTGARGDRARRARPRRARAFSRRDAARANRRRARRRAATASYRIWGRRPTARSPRSRRSAATRERSISPPASRGSTKRTARSKRWAR